MTEAERQDTRKAMALDLCHIIDENPTQESYTPEEVKKLIPCTFFLQGRSNGNRTITQTKAPPLAGPLSI